MRTLILFVLMLVTPVFTLTAGIYPDKAGKPPLTTQSINEQQATPEELAINATETTAITCDDLVGLGEGGAVYSIMTSQDEGNATCLQSTAITATTTSIPKKPETTKFTSEALLTDPGDYSWLGEAEHAQSLSENPMNSKAQLSISSAFVVDTTIGIRDTGDSFRLGYAERAQQSETLMNEQMTPNPEWGIGGHQIA